MARWLLKFHALEPRQELRRWLDALPDFRGLLLQASIQLPQNIQFMPTVWAAFEMIFNGKNVLTSDRTLDILWESFLNPVTPHDPSSLSK